MKGSVDSIETFGLVDGPGIRTVVFLTGCKLRCKYCCNPEMWLMRNKNYTPEELANIIIKNKPYYKNNGGVTFSGGEPLLQGDFIIEVAKILKRENIHIAIDTCGVGSGCYDEILKYVDLIIFDVKHTDEIKYKELTGHKIDDSLKFIESANKLNKKFWIRQVIVPNMMDNYKYLESLGKFLKKIKNIEKIEFLPYHRLGIDKYKKLKIKYPYQNLKEMDKNKCEELYKYFMKNIYNKN